MAGTCRTSSRRLRSDVYFRFLVKRRDIPCRYSSRCSSRERDADLRSSLADFIAPIGHSSVIPLASPALDLLALPRCETPRRVFLTVFTPPRSIVALYIPLWRRLLAAVSGSFSGNTLYYFFFPPPVILFFLSPHRGVPAVADRSFLSRGSGISSLATSARFPVTLSCATSPSPRNGL